MKNWVCPICGKTQEPRTIAQVTWSTPIPGPKNYNVIRCSHCDGDISDPMPSEEVLSEYYSDYHPTQVLEEQYRANDLIDLQEPILTYLTDQLGGFKAGMSFLDYGFGAGAFLLKVAQKGMSATGLDFGAQNIEQLKALSQQRGLNIDLYDMANGGMLALRGKTFDCITMFQVVEHLVSPLEVLADLRELQKPGGILYIECPNQAGLFFNIKNLVRSVINRKFMWGALSPPQHVLGFRKKSLQMLLERAGYEPIEVNDYRVADGIHAPETPYWYPSVREWLTNRNRWNAYGTAKMLIRLADYPASKIFSAGGGLYAIARRI